MADTPTPAPKPPRPGQRQVRSFTAAELAQYDGVEGREAYIAYKGFVFDVTASKLWRKGLHVNQHRAGLDLTAEMAGSPHADEVMVGMPMVGVLVAEGEASAERPELIAREAPPLIAFVLRRHLHPVSVHYPIALGLFAALFTAASLVMRGPTVALFQTLAWWMLLISALFTAPAAITGLWSWWYNYGSPLNYIYKWKIGLTIALCFISGAALLLRWLAIPDMAQQTPAFWAYTLLVIAHGPIVLGLGWFGGKITFPD